MVTFNKFNINPKGKKTGDCSIRALASAVGISWDEALDELVEMSHKTKYSPNARETMEKVLEKHGFFKMKQPRKADNTKYRVGELDKVLSGDYTAVVNVANHYTVIKSGECIDSWDCRSKTSGNIFFKEEVPGHYKKAEPERARFIL